MENLSHTLIGLAAGESFAHCTRPGLGLPQAARRSLFVTLAVIGGNAPDLDLAWSYLGSSRRLGYMLEHRGYTHTLVGCIALAVLLYAGAEWWMQRRGFTPSVRDRIQIAVVAVLGTLLHLGMDALNSYGVHPLWPFDNRWFYGDSIFIAEPLFWLASAPLIPLMRSRLARALLSGVLLLGLAASVWVHRGTPIWAGGLVVVAVGLVFVGRLASPRAAALASAALMALVVGASVTCGMLAASRIETIANSSFPQYRTLDHILTPTPTYPVCWDALVLSSWGDRYTVRHAVLSVAPGFVRAADCPELFAPPPARSSSVMPPGPPGARVNAVDSASIQWLAEYSMSRAQLLRLVEEHCEAAALMQFARAPFAFQYASAWFLGDLRFDRGAGFQIEVGSTASSRCSIHVPWVPPRMDLLRAPSGSGG